MNGRRAHFTAQAIVTLLQAIHPRRMLVLNAHWHFQQRRLAFTTNIVLVEKVGVLREMTVIGAAVALRRAFRRFPVHPRRNRTIHQIAILHQQTRVALVKGPASCAMADHFGLEGLLQQAGHIVDFRPHRRIAVLDQIRFMPPVVIGKRVGRWAVPGMQMHADFRRPPGNHIFGEFDINRVDGHFIVGQPDRFETVLFAKLLKTR